MRYVSTTPLGEERAARAMELLSEDYPDLRPVFEKLQVSTLPQDEFIRTIDQFNASHRAAIPYFKDYFYLPNGRKIEYMWDNDGGIELGYELPPQEDEDTVIPEFGRAVLIDGNLVGREFTRFFLSAMLESLYGGPKYTELYFETTDGNIYTIHIDRRSGRAAIADGFSNRSSSTFQGRWLSDHDLENGVIQVGEPFRFGTQNATPIVVSIVCVTASRSFTPELHDSHTQHRSTSIRNRFRSMLHLT